VLDVPAPACTNGAWPPLQPVSVAQNKQSTMLSSNVQSIDHPMDCTTLTMIQSNGCTTPAPRSSAAQQWFERTDSNNEGDLPIDRANEIL